MEEDLRDEIEVNNDHNRFEDKEDDSEDEDIFIEL